MAASSSGARSCTAALREQVLHTQIPIQFGARLVDVTEVGGVEARFADAQLAEGELLIGADGINSPTRTANDPHAPQSAYTGMVGIGGFARRRIGRHAEHS